MSNNQQVESCDSHVLSVAEIDERMERDGFPELRMIWGWAKKLKLLPSELRDEEIEKLRRGHVELLFGYPLWVSLFLLCLSFIVAIRLESLCGTLLFGLLGQQQLAIESLLAPLEFSTDIVWIHYQCWKILGLFFLFAYLQLLVQRYFVVGLRRVMAMDLAYMLSRADFRKTLDSSARALAVQQRLSEAGVKSWDDAGYVRRYSASSGEPLAEGVRSRSQFVHLALREFLGSKSEETRKFSPGRFTASLLKGKKSVTAYLESRLERVQACKASETTREEERALLEGLQDFVQPKSKGAKHLAEVLFAFEERSYLFGNEVQAEVWQRDPWVDLTHQEEFYSSASLRGVKLMGRGPKGRIGTFGYLRNKSISALDLRTRRGRCVRVRMAIVECGEDVLALYVDGVEGSNELKPKVIMRAIEEYAAECGLLVVLYNTLVHNTVPRRFIGYLGRRALPLRRTKIAYLDDSTPEYLDAFAWPLEPFEYALPRGKVLTYIGGKMPKRVPARTPTRSMLLLRWLRMKILWLGVLPITAFAVIQGMATFPVPATVFLVLVLALFTIHLRYQRKSLGTS